eukprot:12679486-Heterocapsa_arctica.AAC.1
MSPTSRRNRCSLNRPTSCSRPRPLCQRAWCPRHGLRPCALSLARARIAAASGRLSSAVVAAVLRVGLLARGDLASYTLVVLVVLGLVVAQVTAVHLAGL